MLSTPTRANVAISWSSKRFLRSLTILLAPTYFNIPQVYDFLDTFTYVILYLVFFMLTPTHRFAKGKGLLILLLPPSCCWTRERERGKEAINLCPRWSMLYYREILERVRCPMSNFSSQHTHTSGGRGMDRACVCVCGNCGCCCCWGHINTYIKLGWGRMKIRQIHVHPIHHVKITFVFVHTEGKHERSFRPAKS